MADLAGDQVRREKNLCIVWCLSGREEISKWPPVKACLLLILAEFLEDRITKKGIGQLFCFV